MEDIADMLTWMERLAAEKADLPEWDGDSSDDISRAQMELARLLIVLVTRFDLDPHVTFASAGEETARWLDVAGRRDVEKMPFWREWLRRPFGRRS